jgi:hypothetical protein
VQGPVVDLLLRLSDSVAVRRRTHIAPIILIASVLDILEIRVVGKNDYLLRRLDMHNYPRQPDETEGLCRATR